MMPEEGWTVQEVLRFLWHARTRLPFKFGETPAYIQEAWQILYNCQEEIIREHRLTGPGTKVTLPKLSSVPE